MQGFFKLISSTEFTELLAGFRPLAQETIPVSEALGRVLAQDITAPEDLPPFSRSTMDGFAVRARDTFGSSESEPALFTLKGEIVMGEAGQQYHLSPGETVRIWTGGELPQKGDAVVMVEYSRMLDDSTVELFRPVAPGENVITAGEDFRKGAAVLGHGRNLRPQDLGILSGMGITEISVHCRPKVAILSTGDELVSPDQSPGPGKIRDINSTTLAGLVREAGGIPTSLGIVGDRFDVLYTTCSRALADADLLLLSGGSSVGRRDFTLKVLEGIEGAELLAHGVAIRPGKPTILARLGNKALFGLPGHAASAMVVFYLFVRPLLRMMQGCHTDLGLQQIQARTAQQIPSAIGREEYVRVQLSYQEADQPPLATPVYGKSGLLKPLIQSDGLLRIGRDVEGLDRGTLAPVLLFP
ncbi:MAG: molybdopterin molybdenumtransferase MoeA [Desulfobulbus propionicus]|nr:MAG: molybdopterin molybdenumtransferase MoeA [Desulfobulbus propionicus]